MNRLSTLLLAGNTLNLTNLLPEYVLDNLLSKLVVSPFTNIILVVNPPVLMNLVAQILSS